MPTVPHAVPSRLSHLTAELYGREDDALIAWRQTCVQAIDALCPQYAGEEATTQISVRLPKSLVRALKIHMAQTSHIPPAKPEA